jgi:hypothetical protein
MTPTLAPLPKTILTPLDYSVRGVPDHAFITLLENKVTANAHSIYSSLTAQATMAISSLSPMAQPTWP